jgi:hypothetical protein
MSKPNPHKQHSKRIYPPKRNPVAKRCGHLPTQQANPQSHGASEETLALKTEMRYELASHLYVGRATGGDEHQAMIPESHSLQQLFTELIDQHFDRDIGLRDPEVKDYVVNVLAEFCQCEQLYKICEAGGRPLHDVGEMLLQADPVYGPAPSFDRERQVRKHIGDYTLFFSGMFPESVNHYRLRRQRLENFIDFIRAGKESYYIVSKFDQFEYARLSPLFAKLAREFESCVYGLNLVKGDLEEMQHPITRQVKEIVM